MTLDFFLPMIPPTATAQEKRVRMCGGRYVFYDPEKVQSARSHITAALWKHRPETPITGAVQLCVKWLFPKGKSHKDGEYKITKPDTDNLQKLLKDCMTSAGFWRDDALVCSEIVEKFWADTPGIYIVVREI